MAQGSYSDDGTLLSVAGQGAAVDGDWFEVLRLGSAEWALINLQCAISMTAGTGTWVLEGRNGPNDSPIQLDTGTAGKGATYPRMRQMRFRWTAASGLTARATVNAQLKNLIYTPFAVQSPIWAFSGITDSFNRADNAGVLGAADTGQLWSVIAGTWGIVGNKAYCSSATTSGVGNAAVIDAGSADKTVTVTVSDTGGGNQFWLVVRLTDINNFLLLYAPDANTVQLAKITAASSTLLGSAPHVWAPGDKLALQMVGSNYTAFVNDVQMFTASDAFNSGATKHGIGGQPNAATVLYRFDNVSIL